MRIGTDPAYRQQLPQIQRDQLESLKRTQPDTSHEKVERGTVRHDEDRVTLSPEAQELRRLHQAVDELPDIWARVEAIRRAVADGTYQIPEDQLIERLIGIP